ncbi:MAG: hypothetical protein HC866_20435 [Leptolyngbyaceae cyanobacterium RU_5_1]|nr:hypothetical protein [Leptolyngbyaceae cyanobacterium RU_5_1]
MRYPGIVVGALTAIALGSPGAQAEEILNPPAALQEVPTPERIILTPAPNSASDTSSYVVPPVSIDGTAAAGLARSLDSSAAPSAAPSEAIVTQPSTTERVAVQPPQPFSDTAIDPTLESPETRLGVHSVSMQSAATNCPLKTEMLAMTPTQVAQATTGSCPRPDAVAPLVLPEPYKAEASPALSIYIPVGFGADGWTVWGSGTYQAGVREDRGSVGAGGVGVGLGNALKYVGLELGYTFVDSEDFGEGGFSAKLHKRFRNDLAIAVGWNGFANIGRHDFEQSIYGVATKVFRLSNSLDNPFSRLSLTVGAGNGQFRTNEDRDNFENGTGIFGNLALRVIRPVSLIAEWTGQDLALGLSIAPFRKFPFVITPAFRDITGSGYGPRFVLGVGVSFKF